MKERSYLDLVFYNREPEEKKPEASEKTAA